MKDERGFTLIEVIAVMVILAAIAAIAIPKFASSSDTAKKNADIATARQVKAALDRYQLENGRYPKITEMTCKDGAITCASFIPQYISKLDSSTTQQNTDQSHKGFGVESIPADGNYPQTEDYLIVIYLTNDGSAAEVRTFDSSLSHVLWSSVD